MPHWVNGSKLPDRRSLTPDDETLTADEGAKPRRRSWIGKAVNWVKGKPQGPSDNSYISPSSTFKRSGSSTRPWSRAKSVPPRTVSMQERPTGSVHASSNGQVAASRSSSLAAPSSNRQLAASRSFALAVPSQAVGDSEMVSRVWTLYLKKKRAARWRARKNRDKFHEPADSTASTPWQKSGVQFSPTPDVVKDVKDVKDTVNNVNIIVKDVKDVKDAVKDEARVRPKGAGKPSPKAEAVAQGEEEPPWRTAAPQEECLASDVCKQGHSRSPVGKQGVRGSAATRSALPGTRAEKGDEGWGEEAAVGGEDEEVKQGGRGLQVEVADRVQQGQAGNPRARGRGEGAGQGDNSSNSNKFVAQSGSQGRSSARMEWRKKRQKNKGKVEARPKVGRRGVVWFSYKELEEATGGFAESKLIGEGGYARVYRATIPVPVSEGRQSMEREVAVKVSSLDARAAEPRAEFRTELEILSRVRHPSVIRLLGCCVEDKHRILVFSLAEGGSLHGRLHDSKSKASTPAVGEGASVTPLPPVLGWMERLIIARAAAEGLQFLHESLPPVIHGDIKSANILLDKKGRAKLCDFGFAKLDPGGPDGHTGGGAADAGGDGSPSMRRFPSQRLGSRHVRSQSSVSYAAGTFGYLAPETCLSGESSSASDVYSFGVVLLELLTGRAPLDNKRPGKEKSLVVWSRPYLKMGRISEITDAIILRDLLGAPPPVLPSQGTGWPQPQQHQRHSHSKSVDFDQGGWGLSLVRARTFAHPERRVPSVQVSCPGSGTGPLLCQGLLPS